MSGLGAHCRWTTCMLAIAAREHILIDRANLRSQVFVQKRAGRTRSDGNNYIWGLSEKGNGIHQRRGCRFIAKEAWQSGLMLRTYNPAGVWASKPKAPRGFESHHLRTSSSQRAKNLAGQPALCRTQLGPKALSGVSLVASRFVRRLGPCALAVLSSGSDAGG